ncbi:MAG: ATP-binding protein [Solirubrobacteraceae bacterium]
MLLLAIVALGVPAALNLSARVNAEVRTQAQAQADLVAATAADLLDRSHRRALGTLAQTAARSVRARILVVDATGAVLVDSAGPAQVGASYESRPEIDAALTGRQVQVQRTSRTLGQEILATAVPIIRNGRPAGAVRVTQSVAAVHATIRRAELQLGVLALIVLALGLSAGAVIAAQVAQPIRRLERVARRVAAGDLSARAELQGSREQRSLAASFNEMTDRIARLLSAQRDFVADASHQLRTPLTGLRLRLEAAAVGGNGHPPDPQLKAAIGEVDRLGHTVEELLILSRGGVRQAAGTTVDLDELADSTIDRWRDTATEQGIALVRRRDGARATAWIGRSDLERALDALIENALRYAHTGTSVTIVSAPGRIEVLDRGPGLAEDELGDVFERFHRGAAARTGEPGSGLGLSIARELIREWGGGVTIANRAGGGAIAQISLSTEGAGALR